MIDSYIVQLNHRFEIRQLNLKKIGKTREYNLKDSLINLNSVNYNLVLSEEKILTFKFKGILISLKSQFRQKLLICNVNL